jgi:hypothetical protein
MGDTSDDAIPRTYQLTPKYCFWRLETTYYERNRTEYGSKTQRIGADSMKKIDACYLCLNSVRNPVACSSLDLRLLRYH